MVITAFALLPIQTSKLVELINSRDPFGGSFRGSSRRPHVLIVGHVSAATLRHYAEALLNEQRGPDSWRDAIKRACCGLRRAGGKKKPPHVVYAWLNADGRWGGDRRRTTAHMRPLCPHQRLPEPHQNSP